MEKDPAIYVRHILEAIANIETDIAGYDFEKFRADRRTRQLVERNLEILSEASRRLPNEYKEREVKIPWRAIRCCLHRCLDYRPKFSRAKWHRFGHRPVATAR